MFVNPSFNVIIVLLLCAAATQATWNMSIKASNTPFLRMSEINFVMGLLTIPLLWFWGIPSIGGIELVVLAISLRQLFYITISLAYRSHDFSLVYPVIRGLNPIFISTLGIIFLHETLHISGYVGIILITSGVVISAVFQAKVKGLHSGPVILSLCLAASAELSLFSLIDGIGVRSTMITSPGSYAALMAACDGVISGMVALCYRSIFKTRFDLESTKKSIIGGLLASFSFWIVILAIASTPLGVVSALRETSILFAIGFSAVILKEKLSIGRICGGFLIMCGIISFKTGW